MDRFENTKTVGILSILGNLFLLIIKGFIGFISKSQAMIADAANSASDIFASLMTFIGNKIASEPEDNTHNFGHGKAEYIFSMFISLSMILISLKLLLDSIYSIFNQNKIESSIGLIVVCIITIVTKFCLFIYTRKLSKQYKNILLEANMKDHRNDCVVTTFTLISIILSMYSIYWFDGVVGIGISCWICFTGIKIFIESYNVLMDISVDKETQNTILTLANNYKEIKGIENLYSTPSGYKYVVIVTILVDGNLSTFESHKIADNLENDISSLDNVSKAIIHVNPI